jgi:hypothetical protein
MGAKDSILMYADSDVHPILQSEPSIDREATRQFVGRLYPGRAVSEIADGTLFDQADPPDLHLYAACFPGLTVICAADVALDHPSELAMSFHAEARGRTLYLHAMHSGVNWFAYAIWTGDGQLGRSLSLSPDSGVMENIGSPLPFEAPYWAGEKALEPEEEDEDAYALPFDPLEMGEDALRTLIGFNYEGITSTTIPTWRKSSSPATFLAEAGQAPQALRDRLRYRG